MNKRGAIMDIFAGIALFLAVAIIAFVSAKVGGDVLGGIQDANITDFSTATGQIVNDSLQAGIDTSKMGNVVFMIIFAGYILSLVITSWATFFHPAYFFLFMILSILGIVISAPVSNAYREIATSPAFASFVTDFPIIDMIMSNLPFVIMLISALLMVVTYAKQRVN